MAAATLSILGQAIALDCAPHDVRRVEDLAAALEVRLQGFTGNADGLRRLALTALALMDEAQATGAALVRARTEIDRLNDMAADAAFEAAIQPSAETGRVAALRQGSA